MGDGDFIELGTSNYGKLVNDASADSWYIELDCLNDYGNSMNGKHLSNFTPADEQAREFTKKLIKSHDDFIASNV